MYITNLKTWIPITIWRPGEVYTPWRSGPSLVQVMAWVWYQAITWTNEDVLFILQENVFENVVCMAVILILAPVSKYLFMMPE